MKYLGIVIFAMLTSTSSFSQQIQIVNSKVEKFPASKPLYIIDGRVMQGLIHSKIDSTKMVSPIAELASEDIQNVTVLKGPDAVLAYGEAGRNGAVIITMKKKEP